MPVDVKERPDPIGCNRCGTPTWSASGMCVRCSRGDSSGPSPPAVTQRAQPSPERPVRLDADGRIDVQLACRSCGYDLRGLDPESVCPECSSPIARSTRPDRLVFSEPAWLNRIAIGMRIVIVGFVVSLLFAFLFSGWFGIGFSAGFGLVGVVDQFLLLVVAAGIFLATTPEAGRPEPAGRLTARRLARWCLMAPVAAMMLQIAWAALFGPFGTNISPAWVYLLTAILVGVSLTGEAAALVYLRRLGVRADRPKVATQTRIVTWGFIGSRALAIPIWLAFTLLFFANPAGPPTTVSGFVHVLGVGSCVTGIGALVFGVWTLVLLFVYTRTFRNAARAARAVWDAT